MIGAVRAKGFQEEALGVSQPPVAMSMFAGHLVSWPLVKWSDGRHAEESASKDAQCSLHVKWGKSQPEVCSPLAQSLDEQLGPY